MAAGSGRPDTPRRAHRAPQPRPRQDGRLDRAAAAGSPVEGRSFREDSYTIHVTTSLEATVERLLELIGDRRVAILTDSTVMDLYGPRVVRALERHSIQPEVGVIPAGEQHKTLSRAFKLLDWLTGTHDARYITGAVLPVDGGLLSG